MTTARQTAEVIDPEEEDEEQPQRSPVEPLTAPEPETMPPDPDLTPPDE